MKYYNEHGIMPQPCSITLNTDTVMVNKFISLNNLAKALSIDANELSLLNPAYTKRIINGTTKAPRRIVIPQLGKEQYPQLYAALNGEAVTPVQRVYASQPDEPAVLAPKVANSHTVKKGETFSSIADKYGIDEEDLRIWNNVKGRKPLPGQKLKVAAPNLAAGSTAKPGKELATLNTAQAAGVN